MDYFVAVRTFNRVADLGSFAAAARDLGMSTSSVSRLVAELEAELGVRLLNRTTRRLSLTDSGIAYRERSGELIDAFEELNEATRAQSGKPSGLLRVTTSITLGESWVVQLLPAFNARYPDVYVGLDISDRVCDLVAEGFDVGVRSGPLKDSSMIARHMMELHYIVCGSPEYVAAHGMPRSPDDLARHKCILYSQPNLTGETWWFEHHGGEITVPVEGVMNVNNAWSVRVLMIAGVGIGFVPDFVVAHDLEAGRLLRLMPDWAASADDVHAVYPSKRHLSPKVRAFVDHLYEHRDIAPDFALEGL
ncbi:MAG: LysR family transcriptional regulator [Rhodospirillales bacterium]